MDRGKPAFFLIAGEASGDVLGSRLIGALRDEFGEGARFYGIGGTAMKSAGLGDSLFSMTELSLMGIAEIAPRILHLNQRIEQTVAAVLELKPDAVITIDAPDFVFRVARRIKERSKVGYKPKIIHYVAPSVWAWRAGRAKKIASFLDGLLCLLPFEPPYFEKEGLKARFIGHSMIEAGIFEADPQAYRQRNNIPQGKMIIGVLPGSREGEIDRTGAVLFEAADKIHDRYGDVLIVIPTWPHLEKAVRKHAEKYNFNFIIDSDQARKYDAFAAFDIALATSGTVGLELAVCGVPHVIAYRMNEITWQIVKRAVKVKYAHLANILLGREIIPEFIQGRCEPEAITCKVCQLIDDREDRELLNSAFDEVRELIGASSSVRPSAKAAAFIRETIESRPAS